MKNQSAQIIYIKFIDRQNLLPRKDIYRRNESSIFIHCTFKDVVLLSATLTKLTEKETSKKQQKKKIIIYSNLKICFK